MRINFEYGHGTMAAELPDRLTDVFVPGETVADPPCIPEEELETRTRYALQHPLHMRPVREQVGKGSKVTIIFPDRVKGGEQPTSHRRISIQVMLEELYAAGVEKRDILLICSNGLHRKNTKEEICKILGPGIFHEFWNSNQILNHDSEDPKHMADCGCTGRGDPVVMNKYVYDSDLALLIGHVQGNPYGGYSGGYKHCTCGLTDWRSIASHHCPSVMHGDDFTPVSGHSLMRRKFNEIGMHMEKSMGKRFFCCDAVLDSQSRQMQIECGDAMEVMKATWPLADQRTYVKWAKKKYDVLVFGMPQFFHYGDGMGTNPIMMMQALSAQVIRHKRIMSDNCVILCASVCNGWFHDELWPYTREMYEMFQTDYMQVLPDMERLGEYFTTDEGYIRKYRHANAFHPFHGFSMISCAHIAEMNTSAIYIVGAQKPGYARGMGLKTRSTFEEALQDAMKKYVDTNPNILALPMTYKKAAVHLCMKDDAIR